MSDTYGVVPLIQSIGPFSFNDTRTVGFDFSNFLTAGESVAIGSVTIASDPAGFVFGTPGLTGNVVTVETTAPTVSGYYLLSVTLSTQGVPLPQHLTRSAHVAVLQM